MNGERAIQPRLAELNAELHALLIKIYERQVGELLAEAEELNAEVHAAGHAFVAVCEQADGLRDAVVAALEKAVNGNDRDREAILRAAFARLERLEHPKMAGDAEARSRHALDYRRRLI